MSLLNDQFDAEKFKAECLARKNPSHPVWDNSTFDMADGCTCLRFLPSGKTLIYPIGDGEDHSKNIILPPAIVKAIVDHYATRI